MYTDQVVIEVKRGKEKIGGTGLRCTRIELILRSQVGLQNNGIISATERAIAEMQAISSSGCNCVRC
jgi:hypothetical protein